MEQTVDALREALQQAETVIIGAGAGLSTAAGFVYTGERFRRYFGDFADKYGFSDMYSGGFYPFPTQEEFWAYWSRYIYINRYMDAPTGLYQQLLQLVRDKDYFVLTTNVDHCFQKAGFDRERLFYTQGDYGLLQCSKPCRPLTYDNADTIRRMVLSQGYTIADNGVLCLPEGVSPAIQVPTELLPRCPVCGRPLTTNLRADDRFVEDEGWQRHAQLYQAFLDSHRASKTLFLELGVGFNTPGIIKIPFLQMSYQWPDATYACLNYGEAFAPKELEGKAICLNGDIREIVGEIFP